MGGADFADLQIGAGGDVEVTGTVTLGDVAQSLCLKGRQDAARQSQAEHESVLVGRDVKQAVKFVQKDVGPLWKAGGCRVREHLVPHVEGILRALSELLWH